MERFYRMITYILAAALGFCAAALVFVGFGYIPTDPGFSKLEQLEQLIEDRFIGEVDTTAMEDAAAQAMIAALGDRWSHYIPAEDYGTYQEEMANSYVGIGITVSLREDAQGVDITKVNAGGPAEEAGLQAGDIIVAVDGCQFDGTTVYGVSRLIKGTPGTAVDVTVLRDGVEMTFHAQRKEFQTVVAEGQMLTEKIGLVTIENFDSRCAEETIAVIETLIEAGAEGLIFDVRNNPGGYKNELVEVLDYLLPEGVLFRSQDYNGITSEDYSDADCLEIPMAVLVNSESYSAAEFFAAALSEYEAATVVGEQTCGKGYFQQTYELNDGSAVGLSVGKYYTPNGVSLAEVGITPDIIVEVDDETFVAIYNDLLQPEDDPQIQAALQVLSGT